MPDTIRVRGCGAVVRPQVAWQCAVTKEQTTGQLIGLEHPDGKRGLCLNGRGWVQYISLDKIRRLDATPWPSNKNTLSIESAEN